MKDQRMGEMNEGEIPEMQALSNKESRRSSWERESWRWSTLDNSSITSGVKGYNEL
jgi:hypothetical protein